MGRERDSDMACMNFVEYVKICFFCDFQVLEKPSLSSIDVKVLVNA